MQIPICLACTCVPEVLLLLFLYTVTGYNDTDWVNELQEIKLVLCRKLWTSTVNSSELY